MEIRSLVFFMSVCICCKLFRIKSNDWSSVEDRMFEDFQLLGGISVLVAKGKHERGDPF